MARTDDFFSSALSVIDDAHFDDIVYDGLPKRGYIELNSMVEKQTGFYQSDGQLIIAKSSVSSPAVGDIVVFNGKTYRVGKTVDQDFQSWTLEINEVTA